MEPPPPTAPPLSSTGAAAAAHPNNYPDSVESSPRSRNADSWDEPQFPSLPGAGPKLRLMCSYGGHIVPRPHDKSLCYVGGDTRIVLSDRYSSLSDLTHRLSKTLLHGKPFILRYQLPNEDLDSLISVTTDEDLDNMIEEYDRINSNAAVKSSRLRLFLFPSQPESMGSLLDDSAKSEDWFVNALNGSSSRGFSESASVNCLLGLDDDDVLGNSNSASAAAGKDGVKGGGGGVSVHSVPDSPMLETSSSFGSTSSSPSLANLPPIRVHVADDQKGGGIEEQFAHLNVVVGAPPPVSSPPTTAMLTTLAAAAGGLSGEYSNRVFPDDDRSGEGMGFGYRKLPQPSQLQTKPTGGLELASPDSVSSDNSITNPLSRQRPLIYQEPVVQNAFPVDPKLSDPNSRVLLQQVQDSGYLSPHQFDQHHQQLNQQQQQQLNQQHQQQQQLNQQQQQQSKQRHDQQQQFNQQHDQQQQLNQQQQQQFNQHHHQQQQFNQQHDQQQHLNQQQQQLNQQQDQQQHLNQQQQQLNQQHHQQQQLNQQQQQLNQQQFRQAGTHYIQQHPSGQVPITPYYQMYPPQQQPLHPLDQQYHHPMYYMPSRQAQPYNFVVQQPNYIEAATTASGRLQTPPLPSSVMPIPPPSSYTTARNPPAASKPEMATGMYRTATQAAPPSAQHQQHYVGFSQIHHASQSAAPNSGNTGTYAYEFVDPTQMYYPQAMAPQLAAQYQTMTSGPAMVLPEGSTQLPTDSTKQQIRTSQP